MNVIDQLGIQISDIVSQIYVIEGSGIVKLTRQYAEHCFNHDPQLVGAFIGAMLTFIEKEAGRHNDNIVHDHTLSDIILSCTRWVIESHDNMYIIIGLHQNDWIKDYQLHISQGGKFRNLLIDRTINAIDVVTSFKDIIGGDIFTDYSEEFGGILDNLLFEAINSIIEINTDFSKGKSVNPEEIIIFKN